MGSWLSYMFGPPLGERLRISKHVGGRSGGGGQGMRVSRHLSRPIANPQDYTGKRRGWSARKKRKLRALA